VATIPVSKEIVPRALCNIGSCPAAPPSQDVKNCSEPKSCSSLFREYLGPQTALEMLQDTQQGGHGKSELEGPARPSGARRREEGVHSEPGPQEETEARRLPRIGVPHR
jgi:hypothetical protein